MRASRRTVVIAVDRAIGLQDRDVPPAVARRGAALIAAQRPDNPRRGTDSHDVQRKVLRNDRPRSHHRVPGDGDPGTHDRASADPDVVLDNDRRGGLPLVATQSRLQGVSSCQQLDVRTDLNVVSDDHGGDVKDGQTEVRERPRPDARLITVVTVERRADLRALPVGPRRSVSSRRRSAGFDAGERLNSSMSAIARWFSSVSAGSSAM